MTKSEKVSDIQLDTASPEAGAKAGAKGNTGAKADLKRYKEIKSFIRELIDLFAYATGCSIQYSGCPCNTCFHHLEGDFKHITWLILLGLRGDYEKQEIIPEIRYILEEEND